MSEDKRLVLEALSGKAEAFAPIIERYRNAVFGIALARTRNFHDAEDVAQSVFVEAFQRIGTLRAPERLGAWLRTLTIHRAIDHYRAREGTISVEEVKDTLGGMVSEVDPKSHREALRREVLTAIDRLSTVQKETTTLYYINGYSVDDVARIQEVPVGTVKRRLHDARAKLKEDTLKTVEGVLKDESYGSEFSERVFELLSRLRPRCEEERIPWHDVVRELKSIGSKGVEGFIKAFASPYWRLRVSATSLVNKAGSLPENQTAMVVRMLKDGLADSNKCAHGLRSKVGHLPPLRSVASGARLPALSTDMARSAPGRFRSKS